MNENFLNNALLFVLKDNPTEDEKMDISNEKEAFIARESDSEVLPFDYFTDVYVSLALSHVSFNRPLDAARSFAVAYLLTKENTYKCIIYRLLG